MGTTRLTPLERLDRLGAIAIHYMELLSCTEAQAEACAKVHLNILETIAKERKMSVCELEEWMNKPQEVNFEPLVFDEGRFDNFGAKVVVPNFKKSNKRFGNKPQFAKKRMANRSA